MAICVQLVGVSDFQIPTPCYPQPGTLWGGNPRVLWAAFQEELLLGDFGLHGDVVFFTVLSRSNPLSPDPRLVVAILQIIFPPGIHFWALDEP